MLTSLDSTTIKNLQAAFDRLKERGLFTPKLTIEQLKDVLTPEQQDIVDQIIHLNPKDYGVDTPYAGELEATPSNLVVVNGQQYTEKDKTITLDDRYVPKHVYEAYLRMNEAFVSEQPDRTLLIGSCYRSPAYQIVVFVYWLGNYGGDIAKTIRQASPPTYSQHTIASKAAIDFKTVDGRPSDDAPEDFKDTVEYAWLRKHADSFGFYESWQEGNAFGMRPEPWHWQYLSAKS